MARITIGTGIWIDYTITTVSQYVASNNSIIRLNAKVVSNASGWMNYSWNSSQIARVYIDGVRKDSWDVGTQIGPNQTRDLGTRQYNIPHNANGTKSITLKFEYQINANVSGGYKGTVSGSTNYTLKTIPRASTVSVSAVNLPSKDIKITTTSPAAGSAQNKLSVYINNVWQTDIVKWGSGNWTYSMSNAKIAELIKALGYGATYQVKVVCTTTVSGTNIGSHTATNNIKNIAKPTITSSKAKYDILNDTNIKLTTGSYAAGVAYTTTTSTPTLGTISLDQSLTSDSVKLLINKYATLDKINDAITCKVEVLFNNTVCKTETFTPAYIVASTADFITSLTRATVSFQAGRDTQSWYPITLGVTESKLVSSKIMSLMRITISVPEAFAEMSATYVPNSSPTTIQASRFELEKVATLDDGTNDFRYNVTARVHFSLYDLLIYESEISLLVLKREIYEVTEESTGTFGSIGTKVYTQKWDSYSEKLNNLFYSKSPVPQFFYIPIFDRIPSWKIEDEEGAEVKSPLPTKELFNRVVLNGIDDDYTLTMMYLLCMFEGNRDTSYYKPNNYFKTTINATVVIKQLIELDSTGTPTVNYEGKDSITITKHYSHPISGIPTFETSTGIKLAAYIGHFKFEGIEEVRIIPVNLEEFYDSEPAPEPPEIFDGTKTGDFVQPPVYYKKNADNTYTEVAQAQLFYVLDNDKTKTYGISMLKYASTDTTVYYARQTEVLAGDYPASSMHFLDWYTDGKSNMAIRTPIDETFTVRGYSGGVSDIRTGDVIQIATAANASFKLSGDLIGITKRFYECIYPVELPVKQSYSNYGYWVIIDGMYKIILSQDVVGTTDYYTKTATTPPPSVSVYSSVKMTAQTPPEYYTWDTDNIVTSIIENDIQSGLYQCTVGQYTPPENIEFKQYVENDEGTEKVIVLSPQDLLVYLKQAMPEKDLAIKVVQEDLFNTSSVTLAKNSPTPYLFMDTELNSVGLLKYPEKADSVEFKN